MIELFTFWIAVCYFTMFITKQVYVILCSDDIIVLQMALVRPKHICMKMDGIARFEIYIYFPEMANFAFELYAKMMMLSMQKIQR